MATTLGTKQYTIAAAELLGDGSTVAVRLAEVLPPNAVAPGTPVVVVMDRAAYDAAALALGATVSGAFTVGA